MDSQSFITIPKIMILGIVMTSTNKTLQSIAFILLSLFVLILISLLCLFSVFRLVSYFFSCYNTLKDIYVFLRYFRSFIWRSF